MSVEEFNEKYKDYLKENHYGLDIYVPEIVDYLDKIFEDLTKYPGFQFSQIKMKWNHSRVYTNLPPMLGRVIEGGIEQGINEIMLRIESERNKGE